MALSGMEIFKLLPKTNCRECGLPTCIAFAMSLASGKIEASACPYISDELRDKMAAADAAPIRTVAIGSGDNAFKLGGESVLFRHDKRFNHPTGLAMLIGDTLDSAEVDARLLRFNRLRYRRMGQVLRAELLAIKNDSGDSATFCGLIEKVAQKSDAQLILMCDDPETMAAGLLVCAGEKPFLYAANLENAEAMADLAVKNGCPLAARAGGMEELVDLSARLAKAGVEEMVLDAGGRTQRQALEAQVHIRRAAIHQGIEALRFPTIAFPCEMAETLDVETPIAAMLIAKYAGIVVLSDFQGESLFPLLLERMELFSDPQEPLMTPAGVYAIGEPDRNAPVLLASAWALTYYNLSLAAEMSRTPIFLCFEQISEPDVMCWCHHCLRSTQKGKFDAESTARFVRSCNLEERVDHRKLIISARNAQFKAELEAALPEWEILVGPGEASYLHGYLPEVTEELAGGSHR